MIHRDYVYPHFCMIFVQKCKSTYVERFDLFDLIIYVQSTIFQFNRDGSSWVEPVLSYDKCVLL